MPNKLPWSSGKQQLRTNLLDLSGLTLQSPYLRFALRPEVLAGVSEYLGVVPILGNIDVWYSRHTEHAEFKNSQLFHCDGIAVSQVKIFVYSTTVDATSGPLVVIGAKTSKFVRDRLNYRFGTRVKDEELVPLVDSKDQRPIIGAPGTTAFVDTSRCFHYGSRVGVNASPRITTIFQFLTPSAFTFPINYRKAAPLRHLATANLSTLERMVLGAE